MRKWSIRTRDEDYSQAALKASFGTAGQDNLRRRRGKAGVSDRNKRRTFLAVRTQSIFRYCKKSESSPIWS